jgi:hypothetical protein
MRVEVLTPRSDVRGDLLLNSSSLGLKTKHDQSSLLLRLALRLMDST